MESFQRYSSRETAKLNHGLDLEKQHDEGLEERRNQK
jgi:hypothetical protein